MSDLLRGAAFPGLLPAIVLGLGLGLGVVLLAAPGLWPRAAAVTVSGRTAAAGTAAGGTGESAVPRRLSRFARIVSRLREHMVQAGLPRASVSTVVAVSVLLAGGSGALTAALVPVGAIALAGTAVGLVLPVAVIVWRARAHRRAARVVWPDVVDHLISAVRSGLALPDSVVSLAHSGPPVIREAFADFEGNYRATGNFSFCLDSLKDRLVDPVADRIIETLRMSREVGGHELPDVLRNLAAYLRQDAGIRAEIEARQSWTVNAARLGVAAPWIVLLLLASRPEAAAAYNTPLGSLTIFGGAALSIVAYRLMLLVGRLPEEKRWFG